MKVITRDEQRKEDTWDLSKIYQTKEEFENDLTKVKEMTESLFQFKGKVMESSTRLYEALKLDTEISRKIEKLVTYAFRLLDEDLSNVENQEFQRKVERLMSYVASKLSFFAPEVLKSDYETVEKFMLEEETLQEYALVLKRVFRKREHILSEKEEQVLAEVSNVLDSPSKVAGILRNSEMEFGVITDEKGEIVPLTNENYSIFVKSRELNIR